MLRLVITVCCFSRQEKTSTCAPRRAAHACRAAPYIPNFKAGAAARATSHRTFCAARAAAATAAAVSCLTRERLATSGCDNDRHHQDPHRGHLQLSYSCKIRVDMLCLHQLTTHGG